MAQDLALKRVLLRAPCEPPPRLKMKWTMAKATNATPRIALAVPFAR
jgi:hypothetical protein